MKHINRLWILCIILSIYSCNSDSNDDTSDCRNTICTENVVTVLVHIEDQNQNPVALTSFQVINLENGEDVTPNFSDSSFDFFQQRGQYPVVSDGAVQVDQVITFEFTGFIDNQEVISSNYVVTADCCHISLVSGDTELVLE